MQTDGQISDASKKSLDVVFCSLSPVFVFFHGLKKLLEVLCETVSATHKLVLAHFM